MAAISSALETQARVSGWVPSRVVHRIVPTPLTAAVFADPTRAAKNAAQTAIGRNGELDDLAGATVFLASPA